MRRRCSAISRSRDSRRAASTRPGSSRGASIGRIRNRYNELTVSFDEKNWDKRRMTVVFRVYDDGVGFRYEIPQQPKNWRTRTSPTS